MAGEEYSPPACAFALAVLQERASDPDGAPEEAVEAAEQHLAACIRCLSSPPAIAAPRKKRRARRQGEKPARGPGEPPGVAIMLEPADGLCDCTRCRLLLPEYPAVYAHLLTCDAGCPVLLDLLCQEARTHRTYRRRLGRNPLGVIGWKISGFFRTGQVPMSPMALACGTLILLLVVASLSALLAIRWDDARYAPPAALFSQAMAATTSDTSGCNGAEAAIYHADLQVRQAGHPSGLLVIAFDSGPGSANPADGTDRHMLYTASTQELIGASIAQAQYNSAQLRTPAAPLLSLVLANTASTAQGALQIAKALAPGSLLQVALPVLCRAGMPVISPTATGLFLLNQISSTSLYRHCTPGFAFTRFSAAAGQSEAAANDAYSRPGVRNVVVFSDPSNPSAQDAAQYFLTTLRQQPHNRVVAQETLVSSGLLDGLRDALEAQPRPDLIFAPLLTSDVISLARQQPALMIGGKFAHPSTLQELVQWARQQQLSLPRIYVAVTSAVRPPVSAWQKQCYASFCRGTVALDQGALLFADSVEMVSRAPGATTPSGQLPTAAQLVQQFRQEHFAGVSCQVNVVPVGPIMLLSHGVPPVILSVQGDGSLQIVG